MPWRKQIFEDVTYLIYIVLNQIPMAKSLDEQLLLHAEAMTMSDKAKLISIKR